MTEMNEATDVRTEARALAERLRDLSARLSAREREALHQMVLVALGAPRLDVQGYIQPIDPPDGLVLDSTWDTTISHWNEVEL